MSQCEKVSEQFALDHETQGSVAEELRKLFVLNWLRTPYKTEQNLDLEWDSS